MKDPIFLDTWNDIQRLFHSILVIPFLNRFRCHTIGLLADVSKMFREVVLDPNKRYFHRFLAQRPGEATIRD